MKRLPPVPWPWAERPTSFRREWMAGSRWSAPEPSASDAGERRRRRRPRWTAALDRNGWAVALLVMVLPVVIYAPAVFHRYGFRDDYSVLREAHEEPGKVFEVCAMQARPLYGLLMESSFRQADGIADLAWLRLAGTVLVGAVGGSLYLLLRYLRWNGWTAALVASLMCLLPGAQLIASWAVGWPLAMAVLLALAAFACVERGFPGHRGPLTEGRAGEQGAGWTALAWWSAAVVLVVASALIYPTNTVFYFTAVAAALWTRRRWSARAGLEWFARHVVTVVIGLAAAFTVTMIAFAQHWVPLSPRVALEREWLGKAGWFIEEPLERALGLIALDEDGGSRTAHRVAGLVAVTIIAGVARWCFTRRRANGCWWVVALLAMIPGSFAVNLAVADRWPVYRVLLPLTATLVVLTTLALLSLGGRVVTRVVLLTLVVSGAWLARRQTFELIAWPQSVELRAVEAAAARVDPRTSPRVFVIAPTLRDHLAAKVFADEFGSLSTNSDWVPGEMLKLVLKARYLELPDVTRRVSIESGWRLPDDAAYDVVIDLRGLREWTAIPEVRHGAR